MRLVCAVFGVFCALIALLVVQQELESRERAPGTIDYLLAEDTELPDDPLSIASRDIEFVGISDDGKVVGYATEHDAVRTMKDIDEAMRARGWMALETDAQSIASYVWQGELAGMGEALEQTLKQEGRTRTVGASVLFICSAWDGGSSVVAELL
jgi:hypothetical protein